MGNCSAPPCRLSLSKPPPFDRLRGLNGYFLGDSFVNGTGDEIGLGWAGRLCAAVNASGIQVTYYNLGIRRDTSRDILNRWACECSRRLPTGCDGRIVLSCGVNDTTIEHGQIRVPFEESCANVYQILHDAKAYQVMMVGPPPMDEAQNERLRTLSSAYANIAASLDVPYIDIFSPLGYSTE
ncbi:MAG: GDSL-type esterase/lipase family protein [Chloroflexota bacterium]